MQQTDTSPCQLTRLNSTFWPALSVDKGVKAGLSGSDSPPSTSMPTATSCRGSAASLRETFGMAAE